VTAGGRTARPAPDVAIVGGGIVGTALAAELAARGARVVLFERTVVAAGASGRNSGVVWYPADPVLGSLYRETLARYRVLAVEARETLPAGTPGHDFALGDEPAGILTLGWDEAAIRALAGRIAITNPELRPAYVGPDELRRLEAGLVHGLAAVRLDIGFPVAPAHATQAFAGLARARGAAIREGAAARVVREPGGSVAIDADGAIIRPGAVVVAAGPWTPDVVDPTGAWRPIVPFWGVLVELALAAAPRHVLEEADVETAIHPDGDLAGDAGGASGFSLVPAGGGRSSLGSTFLPSEPDPEAWEPRLRARGATYLAAIADARRTGLRACARPLALDGRPLVGAVPGVPGLYVAAGHGPWGISTGPASAAHVAALVLGEPDPRSPEVAAGTAAGRFGRPPG
jgi:glycine/D-amino acid oxidase-like deaminating enzyme